MKNNFTIKQARSLWVSIKRCLVAVGSTTVVAACSGGSDADAGKPAPLRPGIQDSSKVFKGTPSQAESDFWQAIRNGDDNAKAQATTKLKADAMQDPTNGYSAFLAGASPFMPSSGLLRSLVTGGTPPQATPFPDDTTALLEQAIAHLTDPLYLGFSATLLAGIQAFTDPATAPKTQALAIANNVPAGSVGQLNTELQQGNLPGARDVMIGVMNFCSGAPLDAKNPDLDGYVDKANTADLAHRECYSGYHATHGTEGILLVTGDLVALSGSPDSAQRYYTAARRATNYQSWPLHALVEGRISGTQPVTGQELQQVVACSTCHINELQ